MHVQMITEASCLFLFYNQSAHFHQGGGNIFNMLYAVAHLFTAVSC